MKSQAYRMALLYDFYGDVLTERQKEFYDLYYNEDLSLAEIAENNGITRQGVRDVIVRAEGILTDLEDKTGLIKRFHAMRKQLQEIEQAAGEILERSARYDDPQLEALAAGRPTFYSDALCARYFTLTRQGQTHFVLFDDARTLRRKLDLARQLGIRDALVMLPEVEDLLEPLFAGER